MNKVGKILLRTVLLSSLVLTMTACGTDRSNDIAETTTEVTAETIAEAETEAFACYTLDAQGQKIYGFESAVDGKWYLCIPTGQFLSEMELYCSKEIRSASRGETDNTNCVLTNINFEEEGLIEIETSDGAEYIVEIMQSTLPSVQISLNDTTLEAIHAEKDEKHKGNTLTLTDPNGTYDLRVEDSVEIKGRGNTTWRLYDKKAYQIKFDDKTSVLGMGKAKKWVLLANASDDSMLRSQLVYRMAEQMGMPFVTSFEYVDLWIDGEYLGTYLLGEKVEPGDSRLVLTEDEGALFEHDEGYYSEEDDWFYSEKLQRHIVLKEIVTEEDDVIAKAMEDFAEAVDELAEYLYTTPSENVTLEALGEMIDVDSFVKYYLINEYALNRESFATSFYWYQDGAEDVLHLGPIWDFDTCMGNDGAGYTENYGAEHVLFRYLLASPQFKARTEELYAEYHELFASMTTNVRVLEAQIEASATMNYLRWDVLGKTTDKKDAVDFRATFGEAVDAVETWLAGREEHFRVSDCKVVAGRVSEDFRTMEVYLTDGQPYNTVNFAVWNAEAGAESVEWYTAEQTDGVWHAKVDLTDFEAAGMYHVGVHVDNESLAIADGWMYVGEPAKRDYRLNVQISENGAQLIMTLKDNVPCDNVVFGVWSEADGQDDIQWPVAERNADGVWYYAVDLAAFNSAGTFHIHAYDMSEQPVVMLDVTTYQVEETVQ